MLARWINRLCAGPKHSHSSRVPRNALARAAAVEILESRLLLTNFFVTKFVDTNNPTCTPTNCSLREAVSAANANPGLDTIYLRAGTYVLSIPGNDDTNTAGDLDIKDVMSDVTRIKRRDGGLPIIDASGLSAGGGPDRVFDAFTDVVLDGVQITRGKVAGSGGGIRVGAAAAAEIRNSTVSNNEAITGGGVYNAGYLTVISSIISENVTTVDVGDDGGGIYNASGGRATLTTSTVSANVATRNGGGIYNAYYLGVIGNNAISSAISGNIAGDSGGGIYNALFASATLTYSTLAENVAGGHGGGINNDLAGSVALWNSTISRNIANDGGGIYNDASFNFEGTVYPTTAEVTNSTISGNSADNGGGIYNNDSGTATLTNVTLSGNSATLGGAIRNRGVAVDFSAFNTIITNSPSGGDCLGAILGGNNLIDSVFACGPFAGRIGQVSGFNTTLANNGGTTQTHAVLPGSNAIDTGDNNFLPYDDEDLDGDGDFVETLPVDQRGPGFPRILGFAVDVGAIETQAIQPAPPPACVSPSATGRATIEPDPVHSGRQMLQVLGRNLNDNLVVSLVRGLVQVKLGKQLLGFFSPSAFDQIVVCGFAGNDRINVGRTLTHRAFLDGGDGNDIITAGGGNTILLGRDGNDILVGSVLPDLFVGGRGVDTIRARHFDGDVVTGEIAIQEDDRTALDEALAAWLAPNPRPVREQDVLSLLTIVSDNLLDRLQLDPGLDFLL